MRTAASIAARRVRRSVLVTTATRGGPSSGRIPDGYTPHGDGWAGGGLPGGSIGHRALVTAIVQSYRPEEVRMKFQIRKTSNNQYRFNIVASNGQVVATSETYVQKASAVSAIESIKKNVGAAPTEDLTSATP